MALITICSNILAVLLYMVTAMLSIGTCGFSRHLTPINSVFPTNFTLEERHQMVEMSRNRAELMMNNAANDIIQAPILPALGHYYITRMIIASQLYSPNLLVDTGSDDTWVQGSGCSSCFPVKIGNFKYKNSSSYSKLPCTHPLCVPKVCSSGGHCLYKIASYGGGSSEGWVSNDTFTFWSSRRKFIKYTAASVCGYDNKNISFGKNTGKITSIFGLGAGPRSMLMQLACQTHGHFSYYCLPPLPARR
ncbi:putative nepenthesin [Rosa chinensis]|uniref:Putative nepenthesin n=1 Tax=Rosa chinensis TaxID=74649 RepID=A0A2P6R6B5_ROSCH|nr:putative nepenthesin [Rosa chinensis]